VERIDQLISGVVSAVLALAGAALMAWGALIVGAQCMAWLKFGHWQHVPTFAAFLSPLAQNYQLVSLELLGASWSPLALVPSMASAESLEGISMAVGGSMAGVVKIASWVLSTPLSATSFVCGTVLVFFATNMDA